jgi:hypothetical protein
MLKLLFCRQLAAEDLQLCIVGDNATILLLKTDSAARSV